MGRNLRIATGARQPLGGGQGFLRLDGEAIRLHNSTVPILFLSAKNTSDDKVLGLKRGADDYMTKPFNLEEFLLRVHALVKRGRETGLAGAADFDLRPLLDLVALGTIADVVPLIGENRILVSTGLERLSRTQRPGLIALKQIAQCPPTLSTQSRTPSAFGLSNAGPIRPRANESTLRRCQS